MRILTCFCGLVGLLALVGCGSANRSTGNPGPTVRVQIAPGSPALAVQDTLTFATLVTNTTNTAVTFSVQEGAAGGTVTAAGLYTAPNTPGIYHVIATSQADGRASATATVTVVRVLLQSLTLNNASVTGGATLAGTLTLSKTAPTGGAAIPLTSSDPAVTIPANVTIPAGQRSANFAITTTAVADVVNATISATLEGITRAAALRVNPPGLTNFTIGQSSVLGGNTTTVTVQLNNPAPAGGANVTFGSSNGAVATLPTSATIPAGTMQASATVTTFPVQASNTITLTAAYNNTNKTVTLTVRPPNLTSLTFPASSLKGGSTTTGTVQLDANAPTGGLVIALSSDNAAVVVPASVTVAAGSKTATFTATTTTVIANETATVTASFNGTSRTARLTVTP